MKSLREELSFLNDIDYQDLYNKSIKSKLLIRYESTIQRLIAKINKSKLNKAIKVGKISPKNILGFASLLELISDVIYANYNFKGSSSPYNFVDVEEIYNQTKLRTNLNFDYFWILDSENQTIRKNGEKLLPQAGKFITDESEYPLFDVKDKVALKVDNSKTKITINQGIFESGDNFWLFGNNFETDGFSNRIYFNISPNLTNFSLFLIDIQNWLNERNIPFKLKFPKLQDEFSKRTDNTVLYVPRDNTLLVFDVIKKIEVKYSKYGLFDIESPKFTRVFFKGVSFGESPSERTFTSFGSYRASVLALLILDQFIDSKNQIIIKEINLDSIIDDLNVINLGSISSFHLSSWTERFYCNQNSYNNYDFHFDYYKKYNPQKELPLDKESFLYAAYKIATIIWNEAYFYPNYNCKSLSVNWIDCKRFDSNDDSGKTIEYSVLDGSFEEGIPGVVYFLNQLNEVYHTTFNYTIMYRSILNFVKYEKYELEKNIFFSIFENFKSNTNFSPFRNNKKLTFTLNLERKSDSKSFQKLIDKVVFENYTPSLKDEGMLSNLFQMVKKSIPLYNFHNNFETNLSLGYGYSLLGYFFLRLYDPIKFKPLLANIKVLES